MTDTTVVARRGCQNASPREMRGPGPILAFTLIAAACGDAGPARPSPLVTDAPATPAPAPEVTRAATPTQVTAPAPIIDPSRAELSLSVTSPVSRGQRAVVVGRTTAYADCTIVVSSASGPLAAPGLAPNAADAAGNVSWAWTVPVDIAAGTWTVEVTCGTPSGLRAFARETMVIR